VQRAYSYLADRAHGIFDALSVDVPESLELRLVQVGHILAAALHGQDKVGEELRNGLADLTPEEAAVLTLLRNRLNLTLEDKLKAGLEAA
jgi:hypothetical protein